MLKIIMLSIILILLLTSGCSEDKVEKVRPDEYYHRIGLYKCKMLAYDYYNPITNTFKNDTTIIIDDTANHKIETYYDNNDTLRFIVFKGEIADALGRFEYNDGGQIKFIVFDTILPYLKGIYAATQCYYYKNGNVVGLGDDWRDNFIIIEGDSATVIHGVYHNNNEYNVSRIYIPDYYIR